ncbi:hypothetical protein BGZ83_010733 [Gryganskiella cystojenkinii]|nr:hypothetical protein BGZ83_010733 [Gryganskiella cystojenkinii]
MHQESPITTTTAVGLFELPPELLDLTFVYLSTHDLTVCARVNKSWYQVVINQIWHTFELANDTTAYWKFKNAYSSGSTDPRNADVSLTKNLGRIKVLKIRHISLLNLFAQAIVQKSQQQLRDAPQNERVNSSSHYNNDLCGLASVRELNIDFMDDSRFKKNQPPPPQQHPLPKPHLGLFGLAGPVCRREDHPTVKEEKNKLLDSATESVCFILESSRGLVIFTVALALLTSYREKADEQIRLWTALPASLEQLIILDDPKRLITNRITGLWADDRKRVMEQISNSVKSTETGSHGRSLLDKLKTISILGRWADIWILGSVLKERHCGPALEELNLAHACVSLEDDSLSQLISMASGDGFTGLKTFAYDSLTDALGPLTTSAILDQAKTLENLRVYLGWRNQPAGGLRSHVVQQLLCSAPKLKRFDTLPSTHEPGVEPDSFLARDILNSSEDWVCLDLESFKCRIGDIHRPDLTRRTNGHRLRDEFHDPHRCSRAESRSMQRRVLAQIGRLTKLRELSLGHDSVGLESWDPDYMTSRGDSDDDDDGVEYSCAVQTGYQYACLSMRLEDGFDQLKNLKSMRKMRLWRMAQGQGIEEGAWIKENWPDYGKEFRDDFFTKRGQEVEIGERIYSHDLKTYDWW